MFSQFLRVYGSPVDSMRGSPHAAPLDISAATHNAAAAVQVSPDHAPNHALLYVQYLGDHIVSLLGRQDACLISRQ